MNNNNQVLYKYRSLESLKFFIDIILNNRLFASNFIELNDPMEGHYYYNDNNINSSLLDVILHEKNQLNICSLSKNCSNFLMWSHYSNSHKGVCIGLKIKNNINYIVKEVRYSENIKYIDNYNSNIASEILSCKVNIWSYEEEIRVLTKDNFVEVEILEVIFGSRVSQEDFSFYEKLIKSINPLIDIIQRIH